MRPPPSSDYGAASEVAVKSSKASAIAVADELTVRIPIEPAVCGPSVLSAPSAVHAAGSFSVAFHTFARSVVGLAPEA
jgi:hypothetical protein